MESRIGGINLTGRRSGHLVAKYIIGKNKSEQNIWLCECDCGNVVEVSDVYFYNKKTCGLDCLFRMPQVVKFDRNRIELKSGHTYEEYILRKNEEVPYSAICEYLNIDFETARNIYDKVSMLRPDEIGAIKRRVRHG